MNPPIRIAMLSLACSLLLLGAGCSSTWTSLDVRGVNYNDLFDLTVHTIGGEGFKFTRTDPHAGIIRTGWNYEKILDVGRFPIRLEATIDPAGEGVYRIKMRIDQEALREGYRIMTPEESDGWEEYGWDDETTGLILKKIELQVKDVGPSEGYKRRHERARELRKPVPKVLE